VSQPHPASDLDRHFAVGNRALLVVLERRFLVSILGVDAERVRVSFPVLDFPAVGMRADLEFHDDFGYAHCESEVLECTGEAGEGIVLRRPSDGMWNQHRAAWRVPVDLPVSYKGHVHPRRVEARFVNLSAGGALMESPAELQLGDSIDLHVAVPDAEALSLLGQVVHVGDMDPESMYQHAGLRFVTPDAVDRQTINQYIWRQIRGLYGAAPK